MVSARILMEYSWMTSKDRILNRNSATTLWVLRSYGKLNYLTFLSMCGHFVWRMELYVAFIAEIVMVVGDWFVDIDKIDGLKLLWCCFSLVCRFCIFNWLLFKFKLFRLLKKNVLYNEFLGWYKRCVILEICTSYTIILTLLITILTQHLNHTRYYHFLNKILFYTKKYNLVNHNTITIYSIIQPIIIVNNEGNWTQQSLTKQIRTNYKYIRKTFLFY